MGSVVSCWHSEQLSAMPLSRALEGGRGRGRGALWESSRVGVGSALARPSSCAALLAENNRLLGKKAGGAGGLCC